MGRDIELINKSRQRDEENKIGENTNTYLHLSLEAYHTMRVEKPDRYLITKLSIKIAHDRVEDKKSRDKDMRLNSDIEITGRRDRKMKRTRSPRT